MPKSYADMAKKISAAPPPPPAPAPASRSLKSAASSGEGSSKDDTKAGGSAKDNSNRKSGEKGSSGQPSSDNASMYVRYLTNEVTEAELRDIFGTFGDIVRVDISNGKGFAFIDFGSRAALVAALYRHC